MDMSWSLEGARAEPSVGSEARHELLGLGHQRRPSDRLRRKSLLVTTEEIQLPRLERFGSIEAIN
jgi:hypothetical protein